MLRRIAGVIKRAKPDLLAIEVRRRHADDLVAHLLQEGPRNLVRLQLFVSEYLDDGYDCLGISSVPKGYKPPAGLVSDEEEAPKITSGGGNQQLYFLVGYANTHKTRDVK